VLSIFNQSSSDAAPTMARPGQFSLKSWALNMATSLLFASPVILYFVGWEGAPKVGLANAVALTVMWFVPPRGWKRPHPFSDQAHLRR